MFARSLQLALLLVVALMGCGDDDDPGVDLDAAFPVDARILVDAARQACDSDADSCADLPFERVCNSAAGYCVECLQSPDCQSETSLGPTCQASDNTCRCALASDCEGNLGGSYCHPSVGACGCLLPDDCPAESECAIEPYLGTGIRRCRPL